MKEDYTQLHFSPKACPRTTINLGMWSYVSAVGGDTASSCDLVVSGLREGVRYYRYEGHDAEEIPRYGKGETIRGLDGWNLNVIPFHDAACGRGLFVRSGCAYTPTEQGLPLRFSGEPVATGVEGVLDLHRYGRYVSTASVFRRPGAARSELVVTVVDMSAYYPGEWGVYGGRAIGIDQEGRNIAYDEGRRWLGGRGRAEIYLFVVETFAGRAEPRLTGKLSLEGKPLEILDRCGSIAVDDFDGDGCLEAIILDAWKLQAYRLSSVCGDPSLRHLGGVLGPDGAGGTYEPDIQFPAPTAVRYPGRDLPDLALGSFSGEVFFARNLTSRPGELRLSELRPITGRDPELRIGGFAVPALVDLDGDGLLDLVVGDEDGHVLFVKNLGSRTAPEWGPPTPIEAGGAPMRVTSGYGGNIQGPDEQLHGYTCPCPYDWSGNGVPDLVLGNITGYYLFFENRGTPNAPRFADPIRFTVEGRELRGEWRVRPAIADLDGDGEPELVILDTQGMIARYPKSAHGKAALQPGIRLVDNLGRWIRLDNLSGAQGRAKLVACDWTGTGTTDIIVGTGSTTPLPSLPGGGIPKGRATFILLENVGKPDRPVFVARPLAFPDGSLVDLGTHSCAPTVGDIDGDGELEIIAGEETGRLFLFRRSQFAIPRRAQG